MKHAPRAAQAALLSGCFALLVLTGGFAAQAVRDGLMRSAQTVLPALLPFSVCANLMVECGAAQTLSRLLPRALPGGALLPLGLLCGYPGGAQLAASAYRSGQLTRPQALTQKKSAAVRPAPPACGPQPFSLSFCKAVAASLRACGQIVMYITVFSVLLAYVRLAAQRLPAPVRALAAGLLELSCGAEVTAFDVPHDSRECVGYRVSYSGSSVGIVTDIGYVTEKVCTMLSGCETVMIEANHDREMVRKGSYPEALKQRILSGGGHLSNSDCAALASMLCADGTKHIILAHLSEENNTPEAALGAVGKALSGSGADIVAVCGDRVTAAPCGHECEAGRELIGCLT